MKSLKITLIIWGIAILYAAALGAALYMGGTGMGPVALAMAVSAGVILVLAFWLVRQGACHLHHDIRTPITTIGGIGEVLRHTGDNLTPQQKELLCVLETSAARLRDMVDGKG